MKTICLIFACGAMLLSAKAIMADDWQLIYQTDFSSDPEWITNDSANCYWNSSSETYHARMINGGNYAGIEVGWDNHQSFKLEWDAEISSVDDQACMSFGLFDPHWQLVNYPSVAGVQGQSFIWGDVRSLYVNDGTNKGADSLTQQWQTCVRYTNEITYDAINQNVIMKVFENDTLIDTLTVANVNTFPADMVNLGLTSLHATDFPGSAADVTIYSVKLYQTPEPATLLLLGLGGVFLRKVKSKK